MKILEKRIKFLRAKSNGKKPVIGRYSISMLVGDCLRDMYLQMRGEKETDDKGYEVMDNGTIMHNAFEELFPETQLKFVTKVDDMEIVGKLDGLFGKNRDKILEAKSCVKLPDKPKPGHVKQLRMYFWGLNLTEGYLVYFMNNAEHPLKYEQVFKVEPDQKTVDKILDKARALHQALLTEQIPPPCKGMFCSCRNGV